MNYGSKIASFVFISTALVWLQVYQKKKKVTTVVGLG